MATGDIILKLKTGPILVDSEEGRDLIFRKLYILHETFYPKPIHFKLDCYTDENSHQYDNSSYDPGTKGETKHLRLFEYGFPQPLIGKNLIFREISAKKDWVEGIKEIRVLAEVRRRAGIPQT